MTAKGIIVLEGPDCAGKTTLAGILAREHNALVLHQSWYGHHRDLGRRHFARIRQAIEQSNDRLVVMDRLWPSDAVYGPIFHGGPVNVTRARMQHRVLLKHAALYVLCLPSRKVCVETFARKHAAGEEMFDHVGDVHDRYTAWLLRTGPRSRTTYLDLLSEESEEVSPFWQMSTIYDWTVHGDNGSSVFIEEILEQLDTLRRRQPAWLLNSMERSAAGYIPTAKALIVSEPVGSIWPWVDPFHEHRYFGHISRQLTNAGLFEEHLMWTTSPHPWRSAFDGLKLISLGKITALGLDALGHHPDMVVHYPEVSGNTCWPHLRKLIVASS